jgi:hypothetical protein
VPRSFVAYLMIAFFHTAPANAATFEKIAQELSPGIATRHILRPDLLDSAMASGGMNDSIRAAVTAAVEASIEPGDKVLLCTCSTIGGGADDARSPSTHILRVDRPMAEAAVSAGRRILVAACLDTTIGPTEDLLKSISATLDIQTLHIPEAWPHWTAGNPQLYWQSIASRMEPLLMDCDAVVLAQASMAGAAALLAHHATPVLSSPRSGVAAAIKLAASR